MLTCPAPRRILLSPLAQERDAEKEEGKLNSNAARSINNRFATRDYPLVKETLISLFMPWRVLMVLRGAGEVVRAEIGRPFVF